MIAETAVLSTSPWQSDFFPKMSNSEKLIDFDFDIPTSEFERNCNGELEQIASELGSVCSGASVASSVCSDETGYEGEFDDGLFPAAQLGSLLSSLSGGGVTVETLPEASVWDDSTLEPTAVSPLLELDYDYITAVLPSPTRERSMSESSCELPSKPWSEVCSREQVMMVEDLTNVISTQMGLREQLEVIKIINPKASVSPTDSEFVIDLNCLNEEKLSQIKEFVDKNVRCPTPSSTSTRNKRCPTPPSSTSTSNNNNNSSNGSYSTEHSCCSSVESSGECSTPPQKRPTKKQRRQERRETRQRQRKEYRQMMKERRSGLFKKEEVVSVTSHRPAVTEVEEEEDEDIEVDIL